MDYFNDLIEQADGTYISAITAAASVPTNQTSYQTDNFTIIETCTQEPYAPKDRNVKKTNTRMALIIDKLKSGASVSTACQAADIKPSTLRYWRKNDDYFDEACKDAWEEGTAHYEEEAFNRGRNGTVKDIYYRGMIVGEEVEHHDSLLLRTLERRAPEDWGKAAQKVELTGKDVGPLRVVTLDLSKATEELASLGHSYLIEEYKALLEKPTEK